MVPVTALVVGEEDWRIQGMGDTGMPKKVMTAMKQATEDKETSSEKAAVAAINYRQTLGCNAY